MVKNLAPLVFILLSFLGLSTSARAVSALADDGLGNIIGYAFNIDGAITDPFFGDPIPPQVNVSGFDFNTGLGNIDITISGTGPHSFIAFFDHDIDKSTNTFFNEFGLVHGAPGPGQSWEIDEPLIAGDIFFFNFQDGTLDNTNSNSFSDTGIADDISMAMGWNFDLASGQQALITLALGAVAPGGGFFLEQHDPDSNESVYFSSSLEISGSSMPVVPVPAAAWLFVSGVIGLFGLGRGRTRIR